MSIDSVNHLYIELCYKKIENDIAANMDRSYDGISPIKAIYRNYKEWKRFTRATINPKTKVVYDKLLEYQMERNKNAERYAFNKRSCAGYHIIKCYLKIKYKLWILFWYVMN